MQVSASPESEAPHGRNTNVLTQFAHFQDLTQHLGQLYAAAAKGTLMFIFPATVLQHNLPWERNMPERIVSWWKTLYCWLNLRGKGVLLQIPKPMLLGMNRNEL